MLQSVVNGLITGVLYSLMAIGFALVYNTTKVFHIAAAGIWAFATYMYFVFSKYVSFSPLVSICLAIAICMLFNLLIDLLVYRPLYRRKANTGVMMIASIGVLTIIGTLSRISQTLAGWDTMTPKPYQGFNLNWNIGNSVIECTPLLVGVYVLVAFLVIIRISGLGLELRAMSSNEEDLFSLFSINPMATRTIAFLFSGFFIALSSCLLVGKGGGSAVMDNEEGIYFFVYALAAMIIGGTGSYGACVVGGLFVGILKNIFEGYKLSQWLGVAVFGLVMVVLLFRPQGLIGQKRRSV